MKKTKVIKVLTETQTTSDFPMKLYFWKYQVVKINSIVFIETTQAMKPSVTINLVIKHPTILCSTTPKTKEHIIKNVQREMNCNLNKGCIK